MSALPDKKTIASQLKLLANYLTLIDEDMRAKAYERAARTLEKFTDDLETTPLSSIRGIGKSIAGEIDTLRSVDRLPSLVDLEATLPAGVRDLFRVNGLGAKKVKQLWQADISSLDRLIHEAETGNLEKMSGFGKKSSATILKNARFAQSSLTGLRLDAAEHVASTIMALIEEHALQIDSEVTGELRRYCEVVEGLEFLIVHDEPQTILQRIQHDILPNINAHTIERSAAQLRFTIEHHTVTMHACEPQQRATQLLASSSSTAHWDFLQHHARSSGYSLDKDALRDSEGNSLILNTEREIYTQLSLPFVPVERRNEANPADIAHLITLDAMHGLVHNHSDWSDGAHSLEQMAHAAHERGFAYLAMADHSRSSVVANGLSIESVKAQAQAIAALNTHYDDGFRILHGIEVDILKDGTLDYPDDVLANLDYTVVSVHQHFTLSQSAQTERIIQAVSHPYADILAHPTGRILLRRPSYAVDIHAVIDACAAYGTVIELNASPYRLDLSWELLEYAITQGCHIAINPDAHSIHGYDVLRYGVMMARKAGVTADKVINSAANAEAFLKRLPKRRPSE